MEFEIVFFFGRRYFHLWFLDKSKMSAEYVAQLVAKLGDLGMTDEDNVKVAEAYAYVDEKEEGALDIDDIGRLLEAAGKPLAGIVVKD